MVCIELFKIARTYVTQAVDASRDPLNAWPWFETLRLESMLLGQNEPKSVYNLDTICRIAHRLNLTPQRRTACRLQPHSGMAGVDP